VHHHRRAGLDRGRGNRGEDLRNVADEAVLLDGTLDERRLDPGVTDPLGQLANEDRRQRLGRPVAQKLWQLHERVDAGADNDIQVDLLVDARDPADVPAEADGGRVVDRLDPSVPEPPQLRDRVGDPSLLVPPRLTPAVVEVLERLVPQDEHVLVREGAAEALRLDRAADGLDGRHVRESTAGGL